MSKHTKQADGGTAEVAAVDVPEVNYTLVYRRDHPGNRCSYGIAGNPGIVVFDKGLFLDGVAPAFIQADAAFVSPKADNKTTKAEAQAAKLIEKAAKAQAKIEAATAKAAERKLKAEQALAAAQAKVAAAQAAKVETPAS